MANTTCEDIVTVEFPRFRCKTCLLDFRVDLYTHVCGTEVKCRRPAERYKEVNIPATSEDVPAAQCEDCAEIERKSKIPPRVECPGCNYVGTIILQENGKCAACNAPKYRRGRAVLAPPEPNEVETNTMGMPLVSSAATLTDQTLAREIAFVRFKFAPDLASMTDRVTVTVTSFTLSGTTNVLLAAALDKKLPENASAVLKRLNTTHNIKIIPPEVYNDADMKFLQMYHSYAAEDKFPISFY